MLIKELYHYYKTHKIVSCILFFQLVVLFVLIGTFLAFSREISYGKGHLERIYKDKAIYQLLDGYYDPEAFEKFREETGSLEILKSYYKGLNHGLSFQYLAMFNQNISIEDTENRFPQVEFAEDGLSKWMASFQMNQQAHDYFNLSVSEGRLLTTEDFKDQQRVPVLVGSEFKGKLAVGDHLKINYYSKDLEIEVVGILSPNTYVYFNLNPEYYLDNQVILPYADYLAPQTEADEWFQKVVYFAMVNGYIFVAEGSEYSTKMMIEVETIAKASGFENYLFLGSNPNAQAYRGLLNVISDNYALVKLLFVFSFILNIGLIAFQLYFIQRRRLKALAVHYLNGGSIGYLAGQMVLEIATVVVAAFIVSQWILNYSLKLGSSLEGIQLSALAFVLLVSSSGIPIYQLKNTELISLLNREENLG